MGQLHLTFPCCLFIIVDRVMNSRINPEKVLQSIFVIFLSGSVNSRVADPGELKFVLHETVSHEIHSATHLLPNQLTLVPILALHFVT